MEGLGFCVSAGLFAACGLGNSDKSGLSVPLYLLLESVKSVQSVV